jgi:hypothetical protein
MSNDPKISVKKSKGIVMIPWMDCRNPQYPTYTKAQSVYFGKIKWCQRVKKHLF